MDFLKSLCESRTYPSMHALERSSPRQVADVAYLTIIALRILAHESATSKWAEVYAQHTARHGDFDTWYGDGTDLHIALYALDGNADLDTDDHDARDHMHIDNSMILKWLLALAREKSDLERQTHRLFTRLDAAFAIHDSSMKAIRRLVADWPNIDKHQQKLAVTRLLQMLRAHCPRSEVLHPLELASRDRGLEYKNVCDPETGEGCDIADDHGHYHNHPEPKKSSFLQTLGHAAGGALLAYGAHRVFGKVREDASAGATASGAIATVAIPMMGVQRRASIYTTTKKKHKR